MRVARSDVKKEESEARIRRSFYTLTAPFSGVTFQLEQLRGISPSTAMRCLSSSQIESGPLLPRGRMQPIRRTCIALR